jgi:hypothetical protein
VPSFSSAYDPTLLPAYPPAAPPASDTNVGTIPAVKALAAVAPPEIPATFAAKYLSFNSFANSLSSCLSDLYNSRT